MNQNSYCKDEDEIDLKELIKIILDKWKLITTVTAVITILVLLLSVVSYFVKPPIIYYQAFTTVELNPDKEKVQQSAVFVEITKSDLVAQKAKDILKLNNLEASDISSKVVVQINEGTNKILIGYQDQNQDTAKLLANTIRDEAIKVTQASVDVSSLRIVEAAVMSNQTIEETSPVNFVLNAVIAAILTIMVMVFIIFFKRYLNDKVQTVDEVENKLGIKVIGVIPYKQN